MPVLTLDMPGFYLIVRRCHLKRHCHHARVHRVNLNIAHVQQQHRLRLDNFLNLVLIERHRAWRFGTQHQRGF